MSDKRHQLLTVNLPSGMQIDLAAPLAPSEEYASPQKYDLESALPAIREFGKELLQTAKEIAPTKVILEFGVAFKAQSGKLTSVILEGSAEGTVKVVLEWEDKCEK